MILIESWTNLVWELLNKVAPAEPDTLKYFEATNRMLSWSRHVL